MVRQAVVTNGPRAKSDTREKTLMSPPPREAWKIGLASASERLCDRVDFNYCLIELLILALFSAAFRTGPLLEDHAKIRCKCNDGAGKGLVQQRLPFGREVAPAGVVEACGCCGK
jgi:hypothetical protein